MIREAFSGYRTPAVETYSPPNRQEAFSQFNSKFPSSNSEFAHYVFVDKSLGEKISEILMAQADLQRAAVEWLQLQTSAVLTGEGVPHGNGKVVIATGFGTARFNYWDAEVFFRNLGYDVEIYRPKGALNLVPVEQLVDDFADFLVSQRERVKLIGHSKGGLLSYATYVTHRREFTDKVEHVVFAGSPRPRWVNFAIGSPYFGTQFLFRGDDFRFADEVLNNSDTETIDGVISTAIGDPFDAIIRGEMVSSIENRIELSCSHSGMLNNEKVLVPIGYRFAEHPIAQAA